MRLRASGVKKNLPRRLLGFEAGGFVAAVAERLVFRLAAAAKVKGRELVFLIFLTLVVEQFGSPFHLIGTILQWANDYISHWLLLFDKMIHPFIALPSMPQHGPGFN